MVLVTPIKPSQRWLYICTCSSKLGGILPPILNNSIIWTVPCFRASSTEAASDNRHRTERSEIPKLWNEEKAQASGSYRFRIASWNVEGLRDLLRKGRKGRKDRDVLSSLVQKYNLDVLCLQDTKVRKFEMKNPKYIPRLKKYLIFKNLLDENGYDRYYSQSTGTKRRGITSTAVFVKRPTEEHQEEDKNAQDEKRSGTLNTRKENFMIPENITYWMNKEKHDKEGRLIVVDFPLFSLVNVYVPNSGQMLENLDYRVNEWDVELLDFLRQKQLGQTERPVIWLGDLNVAHTHLDVWNDDEEHLATRCRTSKEERESFSKQLDATKFVDCFRTLHPSAVGHYTYWSNEWDRVHNRGLRVNYFLCDPSLLCEESKVTVRDCYMIHDQKGSNHCPVILELEIKGVKSGFLSK